MSSERDVDIDLARAVWRKPRRSQANGNCVEVADDFPGVVPVRDSKNPHGPALTFPPSAWTAFLAHLRAPKG
jgi:hypothetical protein